MFLSSYLQEKEGVVVTFGSEFCGVSLAPHDVGVAKGDMHFVHVNVGPCF